MPVTEEFTPKVSSICGGDISLFACLGELGLNCL